MRTELRKGDNGLTCSICKCTNYATSYGKCREKAVMDEEGCCFQCAFWTIKVSEKGDPRYVRVDGSSYWIGPVKTGDPEFRGHAGREFKIQFSDGRDPRSRTKTTTNLWAQGPIPKHFLSQLPDNATFLTTESDIAAIKARRGGWKSK